MPRKRWSMGILNDKEAEQVPGSVQLIPQSEYQEPLGYPTVEVPDATTQPEADPSLPASPEPKNDGVKQTKDGKFVLDPQPDDNPNDPLNWAPWRRDIALLCLGWHCLLGGGQTPVLAAGFGEVAREFNVTFGQVALTTGLFMMGLGVGSLISSPLALLYGKRPVYLGGIVLFLGASIWCAASPHYHSLLVARIIMGIGISPCESLPSATIAEIFFLHERAYRIGIYTLLLLGGKNLVPLVSAVIINSMGWRWVFWIVSIIVGFNFFLLFFFCPETFWDRTPHRSRRSSLRPNSSTILRSGSRSRASSLHWRSRAVSRAPSVKEIEPHPNIIADKLASVASPPITTGEEHSGEQPMGHGRHTHFATQDEVHEAPPEQTTAPPKVAPFDLEKHLAEQAQHTGKTHKYGNPTSTVPKTFIQSLAIVNGRLRGDSFLKCFIRPVILFLYPAILWSTVVYSLSVGWLIVLSESVAHVYQQAPYHFTPLQTGLVYLSPFIGGILGTAVAGKLSDIIVRFMARRNQGIYEPEFRLVMGLPVAVCTAIGLMGFGWSAENNDSWIVPTVFFGVISFGCSLGSTTAITFAVDSYRQFAGEALVTLNFSKNVFHGLVFSLFFNNWLEKDGDRKVFIALGGIQLAFLAFTVPLYVFGKRLRMWTVRMNFAGQWS
ncbi:MFS general substrate transporter [Terfezia boudieri ATCC MYA-4762]|uniref:MFS general substrate transporter n=1 Tax=Terfezia boudieri ATCC MYA-4762 TaxID=1051890 RepID=A0A3N4LUV1_9PEZI|nr:MFS general substrate transporter [Terfezia boudieri ATCC MYA-4762]